MKKIETLFLSRWGDLHLCFSPHPLACHLITQYKCIWEVRIHPPIWKTSLFNGEAYNMCKYRTYDLPKPKAQRNQVLLGEIVGLTQKINCIVFRIFIGFIQWAQMDKALLVSVIVLIVKKGLYQWGWSIPLTISGVDLRDVEQSVMGVVLRNP